MGWGSLVSIWVLTCALWSAPAFAFSKANVAQCGAIPNDGLDDTAAIQACIDKAGSEAAIYFPPGDYRINGALRIANNFVTLYADGQASARLTHFGCGAAGTLITASKGSNTIYNGTIRNLWLQAADSSCMRTAIRVVNSSWFKLEDLMIGGFDDPTDRSQGIRTEGKEGFQAHNVRIMANRPIVIANNPAVDQPTIDADHFHFEDIYSSIIPPVPAVDHWHVEVEDAGSGANAVYLFHVTFDGANAFAGGCGILRWQGGGTLSISQHLKLSGIRHEQVSSTSCPSSIDIDMNGLPLQSLIVENVRFANPMNVAMHLDNVTSVSVADSMFSPGSPANFLSVTRSRFVEFRNNSTTRVTQIYAPGMVWLQKYGGKDCCPPTIDSGILVPVGQPQP
jgi:pectate lyase-like protein